MMVIRRFSDFSEAADQLLQEYYAAVGVKMRDGKAEMELLLADPGSAMWVATVDTELAGCVIFRQGVPTSDSAECKRLYVRPANRRMGIADVLMEHLEQFATASQRRWIYLDTEEQLGAAAELYRRRGYSACERYNDNPGANLFFRKEVTTPR